MTVDSCRGEVLTCEVVAPAFRDAPSRLRRVAERRGEESLDLLFGDAITAAALLASLNVAPGVGNNLHQNSAGSNVYKRTEKLNKLTNRLQRYWQALLT